MAKVYLANDPNLNRLVALKVIHPHLFSDEKIQNRFKTEAKIAASLKNPHVVLIYDFGIEKGSQYVIMEYIEGHTLSKVCRHYQEAEMLFPQRFCAAVITQAASALAAAETLKIIHRDIKPSNMIFDKEGLLKISDFGLAQLSSGMKKSKDGMMGTPHYVSPEQFKGEELSHKSDLWSLGVTFYYLLTSKFPFDGNTLEDIKNSILEKNHLPIKQLRPSIDPEISELVDVLLTKNPQDRGQNAEWLEKKLRQYLGRQGIFRPEDLTKAFIQHFFSEQNYDWTTTKLVVEDSDSKLNSILKAHKAADSFKKMVNPGKLVPVVLILLSLLLLLLIWQSITGKGPSVVVGTSVKKVTIIPESLYLQVGEELQLRARIDPAYANQDVEWESDKPSVVSVKYGRVFGKEEGYARIIGYSLENALYNDTCFVQVFPASVSEVLLKPSSIVMKVGEKSQLFPIVMPPQAPQELEWELTPKGIVKYHLGSIEALQEGEAILKVYAKSDPKKYARSHINVLGPILKIDPEARALASLKVTSMPPHASIRVQKESWGSTPMRDFKSLSIGTVKVEVLHRSFPPKDTLITLKPGQALHLHMILGKIP